MEAATNLKPSRFDSNYELLRPIGRGQKSIVYLGRRSGEINNQYLALKVLSGPAKHSHIIGQRMKREAVALLTAKHPNIISMFDFVSNDGNCYLAMEYAAGGDLFKFLNEGSEPIDPLLVLDWVIQALAGLDTVHRCGIIHRDIKPENLLLTDKGQLKLADFGIALLPDNLIKYDKPAKENSSMGTLDYLAPEILDRCEYSEQSDLYALGITMFQMLTGVLPFEDPSITRSLQRKFADQRPKVADLLPDSHAGLEELVSKALAPCRSDRLSTAREFHKEAKDLFFRLREARTKKSFNFGLRSLSRTSTRSLPTNKIGQSNSKKKLLQKLFGS